MSDSLFDPLPNAAAPVGTAANPGSAPGGAATPAEQHSTAGNIWRRLAAGVASVPAAPLGLYGMISDARRAITGQPYAGGDTANEWNQQYSNWVHGGLGITEPTTLADRALEIGGSFATGPLTGALRVPQMIRGALSVISGGLPQTVRGALGGTALMTGASALLDAHGAQAAQPGTPASPPSVRQPAATPAAAPPTQAAAAAGDPNSLFAPLPAARAPAQAGAPPAAVAAPPAAGDDPHSLFSATPPAAQPAQQPTDSSVMDWALPVGIAAGLAFMLHRAVRPTPAALRTATVGTNAAAGTVTPWLVRQQQNLLDSTAPVIHAARTMGQGVVDDVRNVMSTDFNPSAVGVQRMHAWSEGVANGTALSEAPRKWTRDYAQLPQQSAANLENLRQLEREADNMRIGVTTLHANPVSGMAWGANKAQELAQEATRLRAADPVAAQMLDRANNLGRTMVDYAHAQGLITPAQHTAMIQARGMLPTIQAEGKLPLTMSGVLERFARVTGRPENQQELIRLAGVLKQEGAGPGTRFLATPQTMEATLTALMNAAAHNRARLTVLDHLTTPGQPYASVITRTPKAVQGENLTILRNGVEEHYRVTDAPLRQALTVLPDAPDVFIGASTRLNQWYQAAATGVGNPLFAIPALLYNGAMASILRPAGTSVGLVRGDIFGGMAEGLIGAGRGVGALGARALSETIERSLQSNGYLSQILSPAMSQHLANRLAQTWQRSTVFAMQEQGVLGIGRMSADIQLPNHFSMLQAMNPEFVSRTPALSRAWSLYRDALDMVKSGTNIQFYARNEARVGAETAARMSRQLVGDPATRGSGRFASVIGTMPFGNVSVQELAAAGRAIRQNPLTFALSTGLAAGLPAMTMVEGGRLLPDSERENYFDYLYRRMTPDAAARFMVVPIPGMRPEDMPHIALPNTLRVAYAFARDGYAMLTGVTPEATRERMIANTVAGGMSAQPITTPPVIQALVGLTGNRYDPFVGRGNTTGGTVGAIAPVRGSGAAVGEPDETIALPPDASPGMRMLHSTVLNSVVTSLLATAGQAGLESARAMLMATSPQGTQHPLRDAATAVGMAVERPLSHFGASDMWGQSQRVSTDNEDGRQLSQARAQLQRINTEFSANVTNQGWAGSRAGGQPDPNLEQLTGVPDFNMRVLMGDANRFNRTLANTEMRALQALRNQQAGIAGTPSLSPRERANARDDINRQIMERQRSVLQQIRTFEYEQSVHWGRRIRLQDITRGRAVSDLPPL